MNVTKANQWHKINNNNRLTRTSQQQNVWETVRLTRTSKDEKLMLSTFASTRRLRSTCISGVIRLTLSVTSLVFRRDTNEFRYDRNSRFCSKNNLPRQHHNRPRVLQWHVATHYTDWVNKWQTEHRNTNIHSPCLSPRHKTRRRPNGT